MNVTQLTGGETGSFGMLVDVVAPGGALVLSGAGLSTESGIPDYRGPTGLARPARTPMTYQAFTGSATARRRYWARSYLGWRHIARAVPNDGHRAVAELSRRGLLAGIITQNVDGLHQAAGAADGDRAARQPAPGPLPVVRAADGAGRAGPAAGGGQPRLGPRAGLAASVNPDGDAVLDDEAAASFRVVDCSACGGVLKPDVVFFGENVPPPRVQACYDLVEAASALVVLGSSLTVMSGFRYVRHAAGCERPVVIVNQGATRGDDYATATLDAPLGQILTALVAALLQPAALRQRAHPPLPLSSGHPRARGWAVA